MYYGQLSEAQQRLYLKILQEIRDFFPLMAEESCILLTNAIATTVLADELALASSDGETVKSLAERNKFFKAIDDLALAAKDL